VLPGASLLRRFDTKGLRHLLSDAGLSVEPIRGSGVLADLVPGPVLELNPGAADALAELELRVSGLPPLRDVGTRLHAMARKQRPNVAQGVAHSANARTDQTPGCPFCPSLAPTRTVVRSALGMISSTKTSPEPWTSENPVPTTLLPKQLVVTPLDRESNSVTVLDRRRPGTTGSTQIR
jgi:hypothetical protein